MWLALNRLNSATKYPSIETFHKLGDKGMLEAETSFKFSGEEKALLTEKIDGTNTRIIIFQDDTEELDWIIGSRENLLYAKGDRIVCSEEVQWLVDRIIQRYLNKLKDSVFSLPDMANGVFTIYGELYGGKIGSHSVSYTGSKNIDFKIFDASYITSEEVNRLSCYDIEDIASWRNRGGQHWVDEELLLQISLETGFLLTPREVIHDPAKLFNDISREDMYRFMKAYSKSNSVIDDGGRGDAEGLVIRTTDRSYIAKARFEDYRRTFKRSGIVIE